MESVAKCKFNMSSAPYVDRFHGGVISLMHVSISFSVETTFISKNYMYAS